MSFNNSIKNNQVRFIKWIIKQNVSPIHKGELMELSKTRPLKLLGMLVKRLKEGKDFLESHMEAEKEFLNESIEEKK